MPAPPRPEYFSAPRQLTDNGFMRFTALVPMKGHSERLPGKNLRPFGGQPLLAAVIRALADSNVVDEILVNTDSPAIGKAAEAASRLVRVIDRPNALCGDEVSMNRIIAHDLGCCDGDRFIQTHATNPLLRPATIRAAAHRYAEAIEAGEGDSLFSVTRHQVRFYTTSGDAVNHDPSELKPTQDLDPLYEENSCLYLFNRESFAAAGGRRIGARPIMFEIDRLEAVDIDELSEFRLAEALYAQRLGGPHAEAV